MSTIGFLFDIKRFAVHDGPGIRTTLFLKGCSLKCAWCHNPESHSRHPQLAYYPHKCIHCGQCLSACDQAAHEMNQEKHIFHRDKCIACGACESVCLGNALKLYDQQMTVEETLTLVLADRDFYEQSNGGVTLCGGEPLIQSKFCFELLSALKKEKINTAVDTCGSVEWKNIETVLPVSDLFLYDLKHIDDSKHREYTGSSNHVILDNLQKLSQCDIPIEIRIPIIPGFNSDPQSLDAFGQVLSELSNITAVKILAYHDLARSKYNALGMPDTMPHVNTPSPEKMDTAAARLKEFGLTVKQ